MNSPTNPVQPQDAFEDEPRPDLLIESLLSEWLGGDTPRDQPHEFEAISVAAHNQRFGKTLFTDEELLAAANKAWEETQFDASLLEANYIPSTAKSHENRVSLREHLPEHSSDTAPYAKWIAVALAASMTGILVAYPIWRWQSNTDATAMDRQRMEFPKLGSGPEDLFPSPTPLTPSPNAGIADANMAGGNIPDSSTSGSAAADSKTTDADLTQLAHGEPNSNPSGDAKPTPSTSPNAGSPSRSLLAQGSTPAASPSSSHRDGGTDRKQRLGSMADQQTVEVIDDQLKHLWDRLKVAQGKVADLPTLENRLGQVLIGRSPTAAEQEWARKATGTNNPIDQAHALAQRWIESDEFELHWARALSEYYLDSSLAVEENESLQRFVSWLKQEIDVGAPLASTETKLLTTNLAIDTPESHWLRRWIAVGRNAPSRLLSSADRKAVGHDSEQVAALETVALQSIRLSGHSIAACSQCHRQMDSHVIPHPGMEIAGVQNESLFGTASAFVSLLNADPSRTDKHELYASDAEGKVSLIPPTYPNGKPIPAGMDTRLAVGQWFEENSHARQPLIDFVWTRMLGQPLVPKVGLTEDEGLDERRDLLEFLANRAQKDRVGLKQLVYWIAMAVPMTLESSSIEPKDFLTLNPSGLASFQKQRRVFAKYAGPRPTGTTVGNLDSLARWLKPNQTADSNSGLLAQPSSKPPQIKNSSNQGTQETKPILQWTKEQLEFELADAKPYGRIEDLSEALASLRMEWNAVVDHAFLVSLARYPTTEERKKANDLLTWTNGDRKTASARLLNTLLGQL